MIRRNYRYNRSCQLECLTDIYKQLFGYKTNGYFVDVGAYDGKEWSMTWCLAQAGWDGLMIEPNPYFYNRLVKRYAKNQKIINIPVAIGNRNGNTNLYTNGGLTTVSPGMVDYYNTMRWSKGHVNKKRFIHVPIRKLNYVLKEQQFPNKFDVLNIDVEGYEVNVLKGISLKLWKPTMIIVELHKKEFASPVNEILEKYYKPFYKLKAFKKYSGVTHPIYIIK